MIQLEHISAGYGGPLVVQDVSLDLNPGEVLVLLGPNGCGKSTLLKVIAGLQPPAGGQVLVDGQPAGRLTRRQLAQKVTYLPQSRTVPNITAYRMVLHGRFPYLSYPRRYRPEDHAAARKALEQADAWELARCPSRPSAAASGRRSIWPWPWPRTPRPSSWTSPPPIWTSSTSWTCWPSPRPWPGRAGRWCWSSTTCAWPCGSPTGGRCSLRGASSRRARRRSFSSGILTETFRTPLNRIRTEGGWRYYYD